MQKGFSIISDMVQISQKEIAKELFYLALSTVDPYKCVERHIEKVVAKYKDYKCKELVIIGFGKASSRMSKALQDYAGDLLTTGIAITKYRHHPTSYRFKKIKIFEAGHPVPDLNGLNGTGEIINLVKESQEDTLIVCLISGGGSALLVCPYKGITLDDKKRVTQLLLRAGADIYELNTVRKHISSVKGGRLAEHIYPSKTISLILSDVIGDRLDIIASGPMSPDKTTYLDAINVLKKYNLLNETPENILKVLFSGIKGDIPETPKKGDKIFERVENIIIGSNKEILKAAKIKAELYGYKTEIISSEITGEAREIGRWLAENAIKIMGSGFQKLKNPFCLISGGETIVTVKGNGIGGRNMELALSFAIKIEGIKGITLLSAGTDGTDGPTDAAGAIVDGETVKKAKMLGLDPEKYLNNNDSYNFFKKVNELFITGPTGTNVMDIQIVLIK